MPTATGISPSVGSTPCARGSRQPLRRSRDAGGAQPRREGPGRTRRTHQQGRGLGAVNLDQAGVLLDPLELHGVALELGCSSGTALAAGLPIVVPLAEGPEVLVTVVIPRDDVIHLSGIFGAPDSPVVALCAAATVTLQDVVPEPGPVGREA